MEWVLIIWIAYSGFSTGFAAIDHIPGFASENQCKIAGAAWKEEQRYKKFLCVEQGGDGLGKITVGSP